MSRKKGRGRIPFRAPLTFQWNSNNVSAYRIYDQNAFSTTKRRCKKADSIGIIEEEPVGAH
jgi:hypothetical protein